VTPELWGNGVAPSAVGQLIEDRFNMKNDLVFSAFCFDSNNRCLRVLEKLRFEECETSWTERPGNYIMTMGRHKVLNFDVTYDRWHNTNS